MRIGGLGSTWLQALPLKMRQIAPQAGLHQLVRSTEAPDFSKLLGEALQQVNKMQVDADRQAQLLATGQCEDINSAVLAIEKAHLALQLTITVTNRAVEAYKEISHIQI